MTLKTRNLVTCCVVLAMVTVPLELMMLDVMRRGPSLPVPQTWVLRMSPTERLLAAGRVRDYPVEYRHALLKSLSPSEQASVWRATAVAYLREHENLNEADRQLLGQVINLATVTTFANPVQSLQSRMALGDLVRLQLGSKAFDELFRAAGLRTTSPAERSAALPWRVRIESFLERQFIVAADPNCNCNRGYVGVDCGGGWICSENTSCDFWYVGCGIWNLEVCDGYCQPAP